jgi:hypothetical protein
VDLDGDWDAALANGGDLGAQQDQLWINQGNLQAGTVGSYLDETLLRLPLGADPTRDDEFADIDGDGDPDLYTVADSTLVNAASRWWINRGGKQGGALGFYEDQTLVRWVGVGGPGSSIDPALVLPLGGFVDWSSDGDFADLDGDGDLDLVHSSFGSAFSGTTPTRIFLNDGDGFFSEFNPAGVMLTGTSIPDGTPALWCDGLQQQATLDTTGLEADIAETVLDFALGDTDGDFDVDIVLTGRTAFKPRFFRNRLELGSLSFRDESSVAFPGGTLSGTATVDQELGDLDGDGDLDLCGLNWQKFTTAYLDVTLTNTGGVFDNKVLLLGSTLGETEGDLFDFDNDGDLDLYAGAGNGQDRLYENQGGPAIAYVDVTATELPSGLTGPVTDVEVADVDDDGDQDVFVAHSSGQSNDFMENVTQVPDTTLPSVPAVEVLGSAAATSGFRPVRARVFDNAANYSIWYYDVIFETTVDGILLPKIKLASSRGSIFRGKIPANLVGPVTYRVRATDPYGNVGVSTTIAYTSTGVVGTPFGQETAPSVGAPPTLRSLSEGREDSPLYLAGKGIPSGLGLFGVSLLQLDPPIPVPGLPNLLLNIHPGTPLVFTSIGLISLTGDLVVPIQVPGGTAGATIYAQFLELGSDGTFGSSKGLSITIQ